MNFGHALLMSMIASISCTVIIISLNIVIPLFVYFLIGVMSGVIVPQLMLYYGNKPKETNTKSED